MSDCTKWDLRFLDLARHIAAWSKDRSRRVGAVVVGPHREIRATGYNGFPRGVRDDLATRHERPTKYLFTEHAERNALYFAALNGVKIEGCTLYVTMPPCSDCARGIISTGIVRVVSSVFTPTGTGPDTNRVDWQAQTGVAEEMFREAGVEFLILGDPA